MNETSAADVRSSDKPAPQDESNQPNLRAESSWSDEPWASGQRKRYLASLKQLAA
jgi:hypothetical protein